MDCCILFRNTSNDRVGFVSDEAGELAVFPDMDAAIEAAEMTPICRAYPYQIVQLDEL